jgi:hypothetical protein
MLISVVDPDPGPQGSHHFGNLDTHPDLHQIKIRIRIKIYKLRNRIRINLQMSSQNVWNMSLF